MTDFLLAFLACTQAQPLTPEHSAPSVSAEAPQVETEDTLPETPESRAETAVRSGLNQRAHQPSKDRAAKWLLAHPDAAHPVMLDVLAELGPSTTGILRLLHHFEQPEAIAAIAMVLDSNREHLAHEAAMALTRHPDPSAGPALVAALENPGVHTLQAALRGIELKGDAALCEACLPWLNAPESTTRFYALRAANTLGCVSPDQLATFADDASEDIRELVAHSKAATMD